MQGDCTHTHTHKVTQLVSFSWSPVCTLKYTWHKRTARTRHQAMWHRHGRARAERDPSDQMLAYAWSCEHCLCKISWLFKLKPFEIFLGCPKFNIPCWVKFVDGDGPHGTIKKGKKGVTLLALSAVCFWQEDVFQSVVLLYFVISLQGTVTLLK